MKKTPNRIDPMGAVMFKLERLQLGNLPRGRQVSSEVRQAQKKTLHSNTEKDMPKIEAGGFFK